MRSLVVLAACGPLAGCVAGPGRHVTELLRATAEIAPATAVKSAASALAKAGFEVGPVAATRLHAARHAGADAAWADCSRVLVVYDQDPQVRRSWVAPQTRAAEANVEVSPAADPGKPGTTVAVDARFSASYLDWYRNTPFVRDCPSTGVLERRILHDVTGR